MTELPFDHPERVIEREMAELTYAIGPLNAWNRIGVGLTMQPAAKPQG